MRPRLLLLPVSIAVALGGCASRAPQSAFSQVSVLPPEVSRRALDEYGIAAEYRRPFVAEGVDPRPWRARIRLGEARIAIDGGGERRIPLLTPYQCVVVGCEGVTIEQRVAHRHHGVSILREPCRLPGSTRDYPYRITVSVLASPLDTQGVTYKGCGGPAAAD